MTEPVQQMLPFDCKECFLKGCDCTCHTCNVARERNNKLSPTQLTRLSVTAGLRASGIDPDTYKDTMKYGQGF